MTLLHDPAPTTPMTPITEPLDADHDMGTPPVTSDPVVDLEIDGQQVRVPEGTSIMRAAALAGVDVPKLCATDSVKAFGSCRRMPGRDRRSSWDAGVLHDTGGCWHEGGNHLTEGRQAAAGSGRAVPVRPPCGQLR